MKMVESSPLSAAERIERAIARIEAALVAQAGKHNNLAERHDALRQQVRLAIAQLDGVLGSGRE